MAERRQKPHIRSSVRSISLGCSPISRVTMEDLAHLCDASSFVRSAAIFPDVCKPILPRLDGPQMAQRLEISRGATRSRAPADSRRPPRRRAPWSTSGTNSTSCAQLVPVHHQVEHAMLLEIFCALETFRQLFPDGLLDDARARKADERPGSAICMSPSIA